MTNSIDTPEAKRVMKLLEAGGSLRYFYLEGGVAVHNADDTPNRKEKCDTVTFLGLREQGVIEQTQRDVSGYPYYANNARASVYRLKKDQQQPKP